MAKRDEKKKKDKQQSRADAVRAAVDQAFQATADQAEGTQKRVQEIADELASLGTKLRDSLEGARPAATSDIDAVRADLAALTARVGALEEAAKKPAPAARKAPARRAPAAKPAASRAAAAKPAAAKPASSTRAAAKPAAAKPAAKPAAARKPAASRATPASKVPAARAAAKRTTASKRPPSTPA